MQGILFASLHVIAWVSLNLLVATAIQQFGWPYALVGIVQRLITIPILALVVVSRGTGWRRLHTGGVTRWILLMGAVAIIINLCWYGSLKYTTATNMAMLFRFDLLFVVLIGVMLGTERIGWSQIILIPVMLLGLGFLVEAHKLDFAGHLRGDVMVIIAAFFLAANAFIIRHIMKKMDEQAVAVYNFSLNSLGFLGLALIAGDFAQAGSILSQPRAWWVLGAAGLISALSLPLYYAALKRMDVWKLRAFLLSAPVLMAFSEWALWGLPMSVWQCFGAAIILVALAVLVHIERHPKIT